MILKLKISTHLNFSRIGSLIPKTGLVSMNESLQKLLNLGWSSIKDLEIAYTGLAILVDFGRMEQLNVLAVSIIRLRFADSESSLARLTRIYLTTLLYAKM